MTYDHTYRSRMALVEMMSMLYGLKNVAESLRMEKVATGIDQAVKACVEENIALEDEAQKEAVTAEELKV